MKKIISILICFTMILGLSSCGNKAGVENTNRFKVEYESLNGVQNSSGKEHRTLSIDEENPFVYATPKEIIEKIENKETFYVYFGSAYCPWCRSVIEKSIEVAKEKGISTIYYVDIWDGNHKEILRDTYKLNDKDKVELVSEGTEEYKTLLNYFDSVLGDYTLTNSKGKTVKVGEKRIFAPNFIYVEEGSAKRITEGTSAKQTSSMMELTDEILEDEKELFNAFFE